MKLTKILFVLAAAATLCAGASGCKNTAAEPVATEDTTTQTAEPEDFMTLIERYLVDEIGKGYAPGEVCIPSYCVINIEEPGEPSEPGEIITVTDTKVWGDWWVYHYNIVGDTLKCVSGGSHPGMFLLKPEGNGYAIAAFDQVEDGAGNAASAKRIFGDFYKEFHAVNSNAAVRDSIRLQQVAEYVALHKLNVAYLQDHGWPAVALPLE